MSKKWKIVVGVIAVVVVAGVIALPFLGRWMISRSSGVPFAWGFGPGRVWPFGASFAPFAIVGGLAHLFFFALLIGLAIVFFRRCWQRGDKLGSVTPESSNH